MLRVIVKYILNEAGYKHVVDYYVDDLKLPYEDVANVTSILRSNGIPCKDPEPFDSTRVLGYEVNDLPRCLGTTFLVNDYPMEIGRVVRKLLKFLDVLTVI